MLASLSNRHILPNLQGMLIYTWGELRSYGSTLAAINHGVSCACCLCQPTSLQQMQPTPQKKKNLV